MLSLCSHTSSQKGFFLISKGGPIPRVNPCIAKHGILTGAIFAAFANNDIILESEGWWNIEYSFKISSIGWSSNVLLSRNFVIIFASYEVKNLGNDDNNSSSQAVPNIWCFNDALLSSAGNKLYCIKVCVITFPIISKSVSSKFGDGFFRSIHPFSYKLPKKRPSTHLSLHRLLQHPHLWK